MPAKRIYRNTRDKVLAGVCSGIAQYFDVDVAWVRLAFVLSIFASGFGLLAYAVAWIVFPKDDRVPGASEAQVSTPDSAPAVERQARKLRSSSSRNAVGIVLILLGALFFLDQNFWWFRFDAFWPVILIALGIYLVMRPGAAGLAEPVAQAVATSAPAGASDTSSDHTLQS